MLNTCLVGKESILVPNGNLSSQTFKGQHFSDLHVVPFITLVCCGVSFQVLGIVSIAMPALF